jgi:hypothetical protein
MRLPQVLTQDPPSYAALKTHDIARPNRLSYRNCRCPGWLWFKVFTERDQGLIYGLNDSRYVSGGNVVIFDVAADDPADEWLCGCSGNTVTHRDALPVVHFRILHNPGEVYRIKYEVEFMFRSLMCSSIGELAIFALNSFWTVLVPSRASAAPEEAYRTSSGARFQLPSRLVRRSPD